MSWVADLFRRVARTGRAEGPPRGEEPPILTGGVFGEDLDVMRAEALLRKSENLRGGKNDD